MIAGQLEIQLMANMARLSDDMRNAQNTVGGAMKSVEASVASAKSMLASLGIGLGVGYFVTLIRGSIDAADHLNDLSKSTNIAVGDLAGLRLLAKQTGTDMDGLAGGILKMSVAMGKDPEKFKALGVTAKDNTGAFKQLADIFNLLPDIQQRNALSAAVFGRSWKEMAPALSEGSQKIGETIEKGKRLSGITEEMTKASDDFNDKLAELTSTGGMLTRQIAPLLPLLNALADDMIEAQGKSAGLAGEFRPFAEAFRASVILGGNVAFILKGIGTEAGGLAAQLAALARGDFAGFTVIGKAMKKDAEEARAAFDIWEKKMLTVGTTARVAATEVVKASDAQTSAAARRAQAFLAGEANDKLARAELKLYTSALQQLEQELGKLNNQTQVEKTNYQLVAGSLKTLNPEHAKQLLQLAKEIDLKNQIVVVTNAELEYAKYLTDEQDRNDTVLANFNQTTSEYIQQLEFETSLIGQTTSQQAIATAQRQLDMQYQKAQIGLNEDELKTLKALYDQQKEKLPELISGKLAAEDQLRTQVDMWKTIDSTAQQTFVSIFQSGKSAFDRLRDTLKNGLYALLYEMTVKKFIIQIAALVGGVGAATQAFGPSAVGSALGSGVGAGVGAGFGSMAYANAVGAVGGDSMGALIAANSSAWGVESAVSVLGAIPVAGWAALAAVAVVAFMSNGGGGQKTEGGYSTGGFGDPYSGANDAQAKSIYTAITTGYAAAVQSLGGTAGTLTGMVHVGTDPQGTAQTQLQVAANLNGTSIYNRAATTGGTENVGRSEAELATAIAESVNTAILNGLKATDFGPVTNEFIKGLSPTIDGMKTLGEYVAAVGSQKGILESLKTDTEKLNEAQTALATAGIPATVSGLRDYVTGLDLTTQAGRDSLAVVNKLGPEWKLVSDAAAAASAKASAAAAEHLGWQQKLDVAQGKISQTDMDRQIALAAAGDDTTRSTMRLVWSIQDEGAAAQKRADKAQAIAAQALDWQTRLDLLTGKTTQKIVDREAAYKTALDDSTRAIMKRVFALEDEKEAATTAAAAISASYIDTGVLAAQQAAAWAEQQAAAAKVKQEAAAAAQALIDAEAKLAATRQDWQTKLDILTGKTTQQAADRAAQLASTTDIATLALMKLYFAAQDAATAAATAAAAVQKLADTNKGYQDQIDALLKAGMTAAEVRALEIVGMDASTIALYDHLHALQAQQAAAAAAAAAIQQAAAAMKSAMDGLHSTNTNLQISLLTAQGDTAGALALKRSTELAALTAGKTAAEIALITAAFKANSALEDQITAINAQAAAAQQAAQAAQQAADAQAQAAKSLFDAWQSVTNSIMDEVARIRGLIGTPQQNTAMLESQFAKATGQARAGDQEAAKLLPGLSRSILEAEAATATSALDLRRIQSQMIGSLEFTAGTIGVKQGVVVSSDPELLREIRSLKAEVAGLKSSMETTATSTKASESFMRRISPDGNSIKVTVV